MKEKQTILLIFLTYFNVKNDLAYFAQEIGQLFNLVDDGVLHAGLAEAEVTQLPEGETPLLNPLGSGTLKQTLKTITVFTFW